MAVNSERKVVVSWRISDETDLSFSSAVEVIFDECGDCTIYDASNSEDRTPGVRVSKFVCEELARSLLAEMLVRGPQDGFLPSVPWPPRKNGDAQ